MAKKNDVVEENGADEAGRPEDAEAEASVEKGPIPPISHDFLREDMNEIRDRLNDVIERVNNL